MSWLILLVVQGRVVVVAVVVVDPNMVPGITVRRGTTAATLPLLHVAAMVVVAIMTTVLMVEEATMVVEGMVVVVVVVVVMGHLGEEEEATVEEDMRNQDLHHVMAPLLTTAHGRRLTLPSQRGEELMKRTWDRGISKGKVEIGVGWVGLGNVSMSLFWIVNSAFSVQLIMSAEGMSGATKWQ